MCKIKCNARDNKADIKNNTQHFDISGASTKPTQNQVFKAKSQKTTQNQVHSSQNQHHIPETKKKLILKTIPQPWTHWQNNNKHSFKIL